MIGKQVARFFLQDSGGDEGYHLFRLDRANPGEATDLTPFAGVAVELMSTPRGYAGPILVAINRRDPQFSDVFSVDLTNGQVTEVFRNDAQYTEFFADAQGRIRAAGQIVAEGSLELWGRADGTSSLRRLYTAPANERFKAFPPSWQPFLPRSWYRFVGRPGQPADVERMRARSPLTHVANMRAPLLTFQGANDPRVRQDQSDRIVCSLRSRGLDVDYLLANNEGHSFANEETSLAITRATEEFFRRHLGGRVGDGTTQAANDALRAFRAAGLPDCRTTDWLLRMIDVEHGAMPNASTV